ncbi:Proline dehydrogenase 2, mitochondrial [Apostasia shenzhenica]|uniref:Proline dehydrogenase n=1 Tax=Apostasia shenzhenica TaxID=1088818 RepID=A0A2I0AEE1_9ASPA|nr:Proline dehydrogenase 2, mitochondrial [Apostasia shenzhenica]
MAVALRGIKAFPSHLIRSRFTVTCAVEKLPEFVVPARALQEKTSEPLFDPEEQDRLFAAVPTATLVRSLAVFSALAVGPAVDLGIAVMRSPAVMGNRAAREAVMETVRRTVYRQFCAGEDADEAGRTLRRLWGSGLRGILDYGLEDAGDSAECDRNLAGFLRTVEMTPALPPASVSFACVKITAICPIKLLERVSDLLRWEKKNPNLQLPWKQPSLPILADSSLLYHTPAIPDPLSDAEELDLGLSHQRLATLTRRCADADLPLLVDAEYTSVQPAIDYLIFSAALEFNRDERPILYGTIQAYLRDSKERLVQAVEAAEAAGISVGFKLVRGAYLSRETALAASLGAASPIHGSVEETHACYDDCAAFVLERIERGSCSVVLATHNLHSGKAAAAKAAELGIKKANGKLQFAQLMGMADGLSLGLVKAGFQVSKYLPFGPVEQVMPYLIRRAEENRGFLAGSAIDREHLWRVEILINTEMKHCVRCRKELKRRMKVAVLGK